MKPVRKTIAQTLVLLLLGIAIGCGVNAARTKGHIDIGNDYFKGPKNGPANPGTGDSQPVTTRAIPYQVLTFEETAQLYDDPKYQTGEYMFVDARDDDDFAAGHVPGAHQCDHYQLDRYIDRVLEDAQRAEKVIVYCQGGDCDDSLMVCQDLEERGILREQLFLFTGGWDEWSANQMPSDPPAPEQAP